MTAAVRGQQLRVFRAVVYNSYGARCFWHRSPRISEYAEENITEHNLFVRIGTEAGVTNHRKLR